MVIEVIANYIERPTHFPFLPQALPTATDDVLDNLVSALRATVRRRDYAFQALAEATLSEVRRIKEAARRTLAAQQVELTTKRLELITAHVCIALHVEPEQIKGQSRVQHIAFCRQIAMFMCRKVSGASFPIIGESFNRDHSTVIAAYRLIERRMADPAFRLFIEKLEAQLTGASDSPARAAA